MIPKTTFTIEHMPNQAAQALTVHFSLPCDQPSLDGTNPRIVNLLAGLQDHLQHYSLVGSVLDDDGNLDEQGSNLRLMLILTGTYSKVKVLQVATEILRVALLYAD